MNTFVSNLGWRCQLRMFVTSEILTFKYQTLKETLRQQGNLAMAGR